MHAFFGTKIWRVREHFRVGFGEFTLQLNNGTAEPNSRDQALRRERVQGKFRFPCSADHEQDWQPYPVDVQSAESDDHIHKHI